jgi:hypothetical protein
MLRMPHCLDGLDSQLTDGGEVASLMCQAAFYPAETFFSVSHTQGLVRLEGL